jgi:hypothetical protein
MADEISTCELIGNLIKDEMLLEDGQVMVYNNRFPIPPDTRLYITVGVMAVNAYASNTRTESRGDDLYELQSVHQAETISINAFSASDEALLRKHEILMALNSTRAAQVCERHAMHIGRLPATFNDASYLETTAMLSRFALTFRVHRFHTKEKVINHYDQFSKELITNP